MNQLTLQKRIIPLSIFFIVFSVTTGLHAQNQTVNGTVTDASTSKTLPGVNIKVKGTSRGASTDNKGNYKLTVLSLQDTLVFSFVGFKTQQVPISGRTTVNISLKTQMLTGEEMVVVGYGTQKKENLTGAVSQVTSEELEEKNAATVSEALQGSVANLNIESSIVGGEPGTDKAINIRGRGTLTGNGGTPYVLVDGMPMNISNVDPNNIESVSVLKGPSASAIYGARAAFGVILIQTKKGVEEGIRVKYSNNIAFEHPTVIPDQATSIDVARQINFADRNAGSSPTYDKAYLDRIKAYLAGKRKAETREDPDRPGFWEPWYGGNANNDFPHIYYDHWALRQKHNISVSGKEKSSNYRVSAGLFNEDGYMRWAGNNYKKYNFSAKVNTNVNSWLTVNINAKYLHDRKQTPTGFVAGQDRAVSYHNLIKRLPMYALYSPKGNLIEDSAIMIRDAGRENMENDNLWLKMGTEIDPTKRWNIHFNYGWNINASRFTKHGQTVYRPKANGGRIVWRYGNPLFRERQGNDKYHILNIRTSYEASWGEGKHHLKPLVGFERQYDENRGLTGMQRGLITNKVPSISTAAGETELDDNWSHWATQGFFMRLKYNFKQKYLLEFDGRADGSSRFQGSNQKWGFFPSGSVGYHISNEPFWNSIEDAILMNNFKIRASYGSLGNQEVANYLYLPILPIHTKLNWIMGNERPNYTSVPGLISPNLTWETINTLDIGADAAFLNNRLQLTFDRYKRTTKDMFGPARQLPAVLGTSTSQKNNAQLETKGFDLKVSWRDNITNELNYSATFTLGDNRSTVTKYNNPKGNLADWYKGKTVGDVWGYVTEGFFKNKADVKKHADQTDIYDRWQAGDIKYKDLNGDNKITYGDETLDNHGDLKIIGNTHPRYRFGFRSEINYKNVDFSFFFTGVAKRDASFASRFGRVGSSGRSINAFWGWTDPNYRTNAYFEPHMDYWSPKGANFGGGIDAFYPRPYASDELYKNIKPQTKYIMNGAYVRLRTVKVGYTLPEAIMNKIGIREARIFISGHNLLTFSTLTDLFDPEALINRGGWGPGQYYPLKKFYSLGVSVTL